MIELTSREKKKDTQKEAAKYNVTHGSYNRKDILATALQSIRSREKQVRPTCEMRQSEIPFRLIVYRILRLEEKCIGQ